MLLRRGGGGLTWNAAAYEAMNLVELAYEDGEDADAEKIKVEVAGVRVAAALMSPCSAAHMREACDKWLKHLQYKDHKKHSAAVKDLAASTLAATTVGVGPTHLVSDLDVHSRHERVAPSSTGQAAPLSLPLVNPASLQREVGAGLPQRKRKRAAVASTGSAAAVAVAAPVASTVSAAAAAAAAVPAAPPVPKRVAVTCAECDQTSHDAKTTCPFNRWHKLGDLRGKDVPPRVHGENQYAASRRAWPDVRERFLSFASVEEYVKSVANQE